MPIQILMPALSPTMEEGTLAKWLVSEGDKIESGDLIAEIETDKAVMEFEAVDDGTVGKLLVPEGSTGVKVNWPIALLLDDGEDPARQVGQNFLILRLQKPAQSNPLRKRLKPQEDAHPVERQIFSTQQRIFASPLARRIAREKGLDLRQIRGSGPNGRIVKRDVKHETEPLAPPVARTGGRDAGARDGVGCRHRGGLLRGPRL